MKIDLYEKFAAPKTRIASFVFVTLEKNAQYDYLCAGAESGKIYLFPLPAGQLPHNIRAVELTKDSSSFHSAEVSCLRYCNHPSFINGEGVGILISGSQDRKIKIWYISGSNTTSNPLIQTIVGHQAPITDIIDGRNGALLSISLDGNLKFWRPQRGRGFMLNPFFECVCTISFGRNSWLTSITLSHAGMWICYVGDSNGNIELVCKEQEDSEILEETAEKPPMLVKHARWEKVHLLGIHSLEVVKDENVLVSLSLDGTCKVSDPATGQKMFVIQNMRRCMYTGVVWVEEWSSFYLSDEFGFLEIFNLYLEKIVETTELVHTPSAQCSKILGSHMGQTLGVMTRYLRAGYYFILTATGSNHKSVGVHGCVSLWSITNDVRCLEFKGHEGPVVALSVPGFKDTVDELASGRPKSGDSTAAVSARRHTSHLLEDNKDSGVSGSSGRAVGKAGKIVAAAQPADNMSAAMRSKATMQISQEEKLFFSGGHSDYTIRCWDEYDQTESYQFKSKGGSEITVLLTIWHLNIIATGHENGMVCLWNADTGKKLTSRVLKHTVSSLVEANNVHSKILLAADYSGKIAMWNLTLLLLNPTQMQVELVMPGFHEADDPGICSLAFHARTMTFFSGGNDCSIKYWRWNTDVAQGTEVSHSESVCYLKATKSYLLSGDEGGRINLYKIDTMDSHAGTHILISRIRRLASWENLVPSRAITDIVEVQSSAAVGGGGMSGKLGRGAAQVFVVQAGGGMNGRTKIWQVILQPRKVLAGSVSSSRRSVRMKRVALRGSGTAAAGSLSLVNPGGSIDLRQRSMDSLPTPSAAAGSVASIPDAGLGDRPGSSGKVPGFLGARAGRMHPETDSMDASSRQSVNIPQIGGVVGGGGRRQRSSAGGGARVGGLISAESSQTLSETSAAVAAAAAVAVAVVTSGQEAGAGVVIGSPMAKRKRNPTLTAVPIPGTTAPAGSTTSVFPPPAATAAAGGVSGADREHQDGMSALIGGLARTGFGGAEGEEEGEGESGEEPGDALTFVKTFERDYDDLYISCLEVCSVNSDKYEVSSCTLTYDTFKYAILNGDFRSACFLYIGTSSGLILRYSFS